MWWFWHERIYISSIYECLNKYVYRTSDNALLSLLFIYYIVIKLYNIVYQCLLIQLYNNIV